MALRLTTSDLLLLLPPLDGDGWLRAFEARAQLAESRGDAGRATARTARAAAQVARLVARTPADGRAHPGTRWQLEQVRRLVAELSADDAETALLAGLTQAAALTHGRAGMIPLAGLAYAHHLGREGRWEEALCFVALALRAAPTAAPLRELAAAALLAGRAQLALHEFDAATGLLLAARRAAQAAGDPVSAARALLALAESARGAGAPAEAERRAARLLTTARGPELAEVRAEALLLLGGVLEAQGRPAEALDATYRALAHCETESLRLRVLAALGEALARCGAPAPARLAWELVRGSADAAARADALLALLELESSAGDRLAFERCRRDLEVLLPGLRPAQRVEAWYRLGLGYARFGRRTAALALLDDALHAARAAELAQWPSVIAEARAALPAVAVAPGSVPSPLPPPVARVAHGLAALAAARSA